MNRAENRRKLNTVLLLDAVLCVDCETISDSPHDECLVCGSTSLLNLHRLLDGTLPHGTANGNSVKYNLEITAKVRGFSAQELSQTTESITRLLGSSPTVGWEELHFDVEPTEDADGESAIAA